MCTQHNRLRLRQCHEASECAVCELKALGRELFFPVRKLLARALYQDSSLADLYDELTMPPELRTAHQNNDRAVMAAYGFDLKMSESEIVAELFRMYQGMVK